MASRPLYDRKPSPIETISLAETLGYRSQRRLRLGRSNSGTEPRPGMSAREGRLSYRYRQFAIGAATAPGKRKGPPGGCRRSACWSDNSLTGCVRPTSALLQSGRANGSQTLHQFGGELLMPVRNMTSNMTSLEAAMSPELN